MRKERPYESISSLRTFSIYNERYGFLIGCKVIFIIAESLLSRNHLYEKEMQTWMRTRK